MSEKLCLSSGRSSGTKIYKKTCNGNKGHHAWHTAPWTPFLAVKWRYMLLLQAPKTCIMKKKTNPADSPKNSASYQQKDDDNMATYCIRHIIYTFCQPTRKINIFQTRKKRHWAETCLKNYRPVIRMILRLGTVCRPLGHIYLGAHG